MNKIKVIEKSNVEDILSLTDTQQGILFHYVKNSNSMEYQEQLSLSLYGSISPELVEKSWAYVSEVNQMLRTIYKWENVSTPVQIILKDHKVPVIFRDISRLTDEEQQVELFKIKNHDHQHSIEIDKETFRVTLVKLTATNYEMIIRYHHIIVDGWSTGIIIREFLHAYNAYYKGSTPTKRSKTKFKEFIMHGNSLDKVKHMEYWERYLSDFDVEDDFFASKSDARSIEKFSIDLSDQFTQDIKSFSMKHGISIASILYCTWGILLQRLNNHHDVVFGTTVSGRNAAIKGIDEMVGLFINTIPLRINITDGMNLFELLQHVDKTLIDRKEYENTSLSDIQKCCFLSEEQMLFNSIVVIENYPLEFEKMEQSPFAITDYSLDECTNFNMTLAIETFENIRLHFGYDSVLVNSTLATNFGRYFQNILKQIVYKQDIPLSEVEILSEEEKYTLLYQFNDNQMELPNKTIHEIFEEMTLKYPTNIALYNGEREFTYEELNAEANKLARGLQDIGVEPGDIVGIMIGISEEMLLAVLAVLKVGAAYLPVNPEYPSERINYMLEDSKIRVLLSRDKYRDKYAGFFGRSVDLGDRFWTNYESSNNVCAIQADSLAYLIYTSGSTGNPKGVMVEHRSLINQIYGLIKVYGFDQTYNHMLFSDFSFDTSIMHTFIPLLSGAKLCLTDSSRKLDIAYMWDFIKSNNIDFLSTVPSFVEALIDGLTEVEGVYFRCILVGGEYFSKHLHQQIVNKIPVDKIVNIYGTTENTINSNSFECRDIEIYNNIPIGSPLPNYQCYIVSYNNLLQPIGVPGELCFSGVGLARGYINKKEITDQKFISNPFVAGEKMYRTGDRAKWLSNGVVEFSGRKDHQLKVRGFRVEPGEIETKILECGLVNEVAVAAKYDSRGKAVLYAYYSTDHENLSGSDLRAYMDLHLPKYMIPSYFIKVDKLPYTQNGKIDRKALSVLESNKVEHTSDYVEPRNVVEETLASVWRGVLGLEKVGIYDNFFETGGDSIKAIQIVSRLKKYGYSIEIKDLYTYPIIKDLSMYVKTDYKISDETDVVGHVELTPIQHWFFEKEFSVAQHWNHSVLLYSEKRFDEGAIKTVFNRLIIHHDALRMVYKTDNGITKQYNRGKEKPEYSFQSFNLKGLDNGKENMHALCLEQQACMNLEDGPIVRMILFHLDEVDYLFIAIHHLIVDGVSWRILLEDLSYGYSMILNNKQFELQSKSTSFKKWAERLKEYSDSQVLRELEYWQSIEAIDVPGLPKDNLVENRLVGDSETVKLNFTKEETSLLLRKTNRAFQTEVNDILLTALGQAVKAWVGNETILVNMEGHGRQDLFQDLDINRTVGWFTAQYPFIIDVSNNDLSYNIKYVKESIRKIPNKGIGYGILKYMTAKELLDGFELAQNPEICFNYMGQLDTETEEGLFKVLWNESGASFGETNLSPYALDINGVVIDGELMMTFEYNKHEYNQASIRQLANYYLESLSNIIRHCESREGIGHTPSDFGNNQLVIEECDSLVRKYSNSEGTEIKYIYPLSPMQEGMLFHSQYNKESSVYMESVIMTINGELDLFSFENSLNILIDRYDILRTVFVYENLRTPHQVVLRNRTAQINYEDLSKYSPEYQKDYIQKHVETERSTGFELSKKELLIRVSIFFLDENRYKIIWNFHHIILDGWSTGIIFGEFFRLYHSSIKGDSIELGGVYPYVQYIDWLGVQHTKEAEKYWRKYLLGYESKAVIPKDKKNTLQSDTTQEVFYKLNDGLVLNLQSLSKKAGTTLNTVFQAIWGVLLQKYNRTDDVVFGAVVSGRNPQLEGIEEMVGMFINTIPIRIKSDHQTTFNQLLVQLNKDAISAGNYDYYPLVETQLKSTSMGTLIDNIFIFENYPIDKSVEDAINSAACGFSIDKIEVIEQTNFDFNFFVTPNHENNIRILFNDACYSKQYIDSIVRHFINIAVFVAQNADLPVKDIAMMSDSEVEQIVCGFNDTARDREDITICELFDEQVKRVSDKVAVVFGNDHLTYKELNDKVNVLAGYLNNEHNVGHGTIIGILMERSSHIVTSIMGVLKAGGAFLPIDPSFPFERIKSIINDAQINVIISTKQQIDLLNRLQWECDTFHSYVCVDTDKVDQVQEKDNALMDEKLWEYIGENYSSEIGSGGWLNSYTGEEFTQIEMKEYSDNVFSKLKPFLDKEARVLEIGCASGITMFNIAPYVKEYYGTDMSKVIIEKNQKKISAEGIQNIKLECLKADEINQYAGQQFDIVIINSVVQYFPGYNYLKQVITKVMNAVKEDGIIFLGDIMDLDLKHEMMRSLEEFKVNNLEYKHKTKTDFSTELFVSRDFFEDLKAEYPAIERIECTKKSKGTIQNELVKYRYDALLTLNKDNQEIKELSKRKNQYGIQEVNKYSENYTYKKENQDTLAYVLYTSGSTGAPKGVMIGHKALSNFVLAMTEKIDFTESSAIAAITTISFDIFILEVLLPLTIGMKTVVMDEKILANPDLLAESIAANCIDILQMTPSRMQFLLSSKNGESSLEKVKDIIIGGEAFTPQLWERLSSLPSKNIFNVYGPTETTIWSTIKRLTKDEALDIGRPIANTQIYIIDQDQIMPIGVPGELCIGGEGLAFGYINNQALTDLKFVSNPLAPGKKMYRTGDYARWLPDGNIEVFGRIDNQIKLRGYRIELEEIESILLKHVDIEECAVVVKIDSNEEKQLCAYIKTFYEVSSDTIRGFLSLELPDYMIPTKFIRVENMPLTQSGKIDRRVLVSLKGDSFSSKEYARSRHTTDETLINLWKDILNIKEQIGIDDHFFEIGGHSLKATILSSRIAERFEVEVPLTEIFHRPTIRELSNYINSLNKRAIIPIQAAENMEYYPLSSAQKGIFAVSMFDQNSKGYNMPAAFMLEGLLDKNKIEETLVKLIERHEVFRTSFHIIDGIPVQKIHEKADFKVDYMTVSGEITSLEINEYLNAFDLSKPPLLRVGIMKLSDYKYLLITDMHHIISDGVSVGIFIRDFCNLYSGSILPDLIITYKDYAVWQQKVLSTDKMLEKERYWLEKFQGDIPKLQLPLDFPRPEVLTFSGENMDFVLNQSLSNDLKNFARENNCTLYMVMLAAYKVLLYKYTGQNTIVTGSAIAGRQHPEVENNVGLFINILPIKIQIDVGSTFKQFLSEVKQSTLEDYMNQDYPYERLVEKLKLKRDISRNALFDTYFDVQNMDIDEIVISGLTITKYPYEDKSSKADIVVAITEEKNEIIVNIEYNTRLFLKETIIEFGACYKQIIELIINDPNIVINKIAENPLHQEKIQARDQGDNSLSLLSSSEVDDIFDFS